MDDIVIRDKGMTLFKYLMGILFLSSALTWGVLFIDKHTIVNLLLIIFYTAAGLVLVTGIYKPEMAVISKSDGGLSIRWTGRLKKWRIYDILIESIKLRRNEILILLHTGKPVKLIIKSFSSRQKNRLYTFFIDYSDANGIRLVRDF